MSDNDFQNTLRAGIITRVTFAYFHNENFIDVEADNGIGDLYASSVQIWSPVGNDLLSMFEHHFRPFLTRHGAFAISIYFDPNTNVLDNDTNTHVVYVYGSQYDSLTKLIETIVNYITVIAKQVSTMRFT
jgi:hypothetical protein